MTNCFNRGITNPETNPQWLTQGITYLLNLKTNKQISLKIIDL